MTQPQNGNPLDASPEAAEADLAEQQTPVDPADGSDAAAATVSSDAEADPGDLAEQAIAVPFDDDNGR